MKHCVPLFSGIGNVIQSLPFVEALKAKHGSVIACRHKCFDYPDGVLSILGHYFDGVLPDYDAAVADPKVHVYKTPNKRAHPGMPEYKNWFITNEVAEPNRYEITGIRHQDMAQKHDIVIWPGCKPNWPCKQWPYWEELTWLLKEDIAVVGLEKEMQFGPHVVDYRGKLSLAETGGIIKNAKIFMGNEGGISHYSAALGTKTYIVYGATDPSKNMPPQNATRISMDLKCQPCQYSRHRAGRVRDDKWIWKFMGCEGRQCLRGLLPMDIMEKVGLKRKEIKGPRIAPIMICSGKRYTQCATIALDTYVKYHNHRLYVVTDKQSIKDLSAFQDCPTIRFIPLEDYAEKAKKISGIKDFVNRPFEHDESLKHDRTFSALKPIIMDLAVNDHAPDATHILSVDADVLFTGEIMERVYKQIDGSDLYMVTRNDHRMLKSGGAKNPGSGFTMWKRDSNFIQLFTEGSTDKIGGWKGGGSQDLINVVKNRMGRFKLIPDPFLHFISPDMQNPNLSSEQIREFQPAQIHLHGPKAYERLVRYKKIFDGEEAEKIDHPIPRHKVYSHTLSWYKNSGYHSWVKTMDYDDVVRSQPQHRDRLEIVLEKINFRKMVSGKRVLEVAFNNGKTIFWALEKYGQMFEADMFDFDPAVIEWANNIIPPKWNVGVFESDVVDIKKPNDTYDFIFCLDVIEHLQRKVYKKMVKELYRIASPGGHVLVYIGKGKSSGHILEMTDRDAMRDFMAAGFTFIKKIDWRGKRSDIFWMVRK